MYIKPNSTVLFQGDSITAAKREYGNLADLGRGYAMMAASLFSAAHPEMNVEFVNRGSSGDTVSRMGERWQKDCLDLKPDLVSILIGVNDTWGRYDEGKIVTADSFYNDYRGLLEALRDANNPQVVLCEPFVLPVPEEKRLWREDLDPKMDAVRALAREFRVPLVPLDGLLNAAAAIRPPDFWAGDGIHPTPAGHALIARAWLAAVKAQV